VFVANPIRETYEQIEEKYDGYCVLVIECDREHINFGTGKVVAYHEDLATLVGETLDFTEGDVGIFKYETLTDFGFGGPIQVVHHV